MQNHIGSFRGGVTGKVLFIGLLALVLLVPAKLIEALVAERSGRLESARSEIGNRWGRAQTVGAPMLVLPFRHTALVGDEERRVRDALVVLPESLAVDARVEPMTLRRGIFEVPVYTAFLTIRGALPAPELDPRYLDVELLWSEAEIAMSLSDSRAIAEPVRMRLDGAEAEFETDAGAACPPPLPNALVAPGAQSVPRVVAGPLNAFAFPPVPARVRLCDDLGARLIVPYSAFGLAPPTTARGFSLEIAVRGTEELRFLPLGDVTDVRLESAWPTPSFDGAYIPIERSVTGGGFNATWRVPAVGRGYPSSWLRSAGYEQALEESAFGVGLVSRLGVHATSLRAAKYAILFVGLIFLAYFMFEVFAGLRLHAMQYLAVGAANCLFFLLLLAIAEHLGFGIAYLASALASTVLITGYSAAILGAGRRALYVSGSLVLVYAYLYVTLRNDDYALLIGSLGLFAMLATFMMLTRRVDWFALSFDREPGRQP
jgi:inner membrane protein